MITFGKTSSKPNFLFRKLPRYFKENDSYKDGNDEGLLERYLEIFCQEIDEKISPYLDDIPKLWDATELPNIVSESGSLLAEHIAQLFGNPPDIGNTTHYTPGPDAEETYLKLLRYIRQILQTKGTVKSIELFLALYGYEISSITEATPADIMYDNTPTPNIYDSTGVTYDIGFIFYSNYDLVITDKPGTGTKNPTTTWLDDYLKSAIQNFLSPIWAKLNSLSYTI